MLCLLEVQCGQFVQGEPAPLVGDQGPEEVRQVRGQGGGQGVQGGQQVLGHHPGGGPGDVNMLLCRFADADHLWNTVSLDTLSTSFGTTCTAEQPVPITATL